MQEGYRAIGYDINPVMIAIARGRSCHAGRAESGFRLLKGLLQRTAPVSHEVPLIEWFNPVTAKAIRFWREKIVSVFSSEADFDVQGFFLTALFDSVKQSAAEYGSKNPTWIKRPKPAERIRVESADMCRLFLDNAEKRLQHCADTSQLHTPRIAVANASSLPAKASSADVAITSPPYCTRIDYAVSTSLELAVLGMNESQLAILRNSTTGTSTIRDGERTVDRSFCKECDSFLHQVKSHPSKASMTYYSKNFYQYFSDLANSLAELDRVVKCSGNIVLVVQDSYYKGIRIDLARIVVELAEQLEWALIGRDDFDCRHNMRSVNSKSRVYGNASRSIESALTFRKS